MTAPSRPRHAVTSRFPGERSWSGEVEMGDSMCDKALVGAALRRIGKEAAATEDVRLLAGGQSGSSVYRLDLAGEDVVVKVTVPGDRGWLMERARREALFYRDLAAHAPVSVPRMLGLDLDEAE